MATTLELERIRKILRNWSRYDNPENEKRIIALASVEPGGATSENIGVAFNRLCNSGQLIVSKDYELEIAAEYLSKISKYQECSEANKLQVIEVLHKLNLPVTLENIDKNFYAIAPRLGEDAGRSEGYRIFFGKNPDYVVDANKTTLDSAHSYGEEITAESLEKYFNDPLIKAKLFKTAAAQEAEHQARESTRMISEITAYMLDANGKVKREYTQRQYNDKIAVLRAMPFSELVARYDTVMVTRAQRKASVEELRTVVKTDAVRQRQALYERYETIPDLYFPPGKSEGVRWSFDLFRRLPSMEQRRLLDHFGNDQLTAACAAGRN